MSRRLKILLAVFVVAVATVTVAGAVSVWLLPDIIRREAMTRIPALTGRAVRIEDVDLNLFTGRFAVKGIWVAERDGRTPFVELSRVEGRVWLPSLLAMDVRLLELRLVGLSARVARTGEQEFNFSDLMDLILKADPAAKPTRWTFTLDHVALEQGRVHAEDRFVSPAAKWSIDRLEANATGITKRSGAPPGRLTVRLKLGDLEVDAAADDVRLAPVILAAKVTVKGVDLARLVPYVPPGTPVVAESGALAVSLSVGWKREPGRVDVAVVRGDVNLSALTLTQPGRTAPFATIPRMSVRIKEADAIARRVVIERVLLEGLEVRAVRDDAGQIDLLGPFAVKREASGPPDPAAVPVPAARPGPAAAPWHVRVEHVAVTSGTAILTDAMASPAVDWRVEGVSFEAAGLDTATQAAPGTMRLDAELTASSAPSMRAAVSVTATSLRVQPASASFKATIKGFDEESTVPYVPVGTPISVIAGIFDAEADIDLRPHVPSAPPAPDAPPAPALVVDVPRFTLRSESLTLADHSLSPPHEWELSRVRITGGGLSTSPDDPPANVTVRARLGPLGAPDPARLRVQADALRVFRRASRVRATVSEFKLAWLEAYVPPIVRALPRTGLLAADVDARLGRNRAGVTRARVAGTATLTDVGVVQRGGSVPFLTSPKIAVTMRRADLIARTIDLTSAAVEGFRVRVVLGADGRIDLLDLRPSEPPPPAAESPPAPAPGVLPLPWTINVDRLSVTRGRAQFVDESVSPTVTLNVRDIEVLGQPLTWPATKPATITLGFGMPGGGRTDVRLTGVFEPLDVQLRTATRDAEIAPYAAYFPFPASFRGRFNGDSLSEVKKEGDEYRAASRGTGWATDLEVVDPESPTPPARVERMEIRDIDFSWPNYALVDKIVFVRPEARVERASDGTINLRRLFTPRKREGAAEAAPAPPAPKESEPASAEAPPKPPLIQTIVLDFSEIAIENGHIGFVDHTTTPVFTEEISKLALTVRGLSNVFGRQQTTLVATAAVGGDAALDLRGEVSGIGETLRADLVGEIRDFDLTSANAYTDGLTSWVVERGTLAARVHYRIEGDRIIAEHDVNFSGLRVAKGPGEDEAKKRLGLPLGLVVGLMKDTQGNIDFNLPITGSLADRSFDWNSAIWAGAKQAILKALAGPFRAIGRLFTGGGGGGEAAVESIQINPVTFAPGSAVIAPSEEQHVSQVAEFLRKSPFVTLSATAIATGPDLESLRTQALTARIVKLQEDRKLADFPAAVQAYYRALRIPGKRPPTTEEQLAVLREREPAPDPAVIRDLLDRRAAAATGALTRLEGIAAERIRRAEPRSILTETTQGRVEFSFVGQ